MGVTSCRDKTGFWRNGVTFNIAAKRVVKTKVQESAKVKSITTTACVRPHGAASWLHLVQLLLPQSNILQHLKTAL